MVLKTYNMIFSSEHVTAETTHTHALFFFSVTGVWSIIHEIGAIIHVARENERKKKITLGELKTNADE